MLNLKEYTISAARSVRPLGVIPILLILLSTLPVSAQQPFSDGETKGTLFLEDTGGFIQFNAAAPSISLGYMYEESTPYLLRKRFDRIFGVGVSAKLSGKQGSVIGNNKIATNAGFNISGGFKYLIARKFNPDGIRITPDFLARLERKLRADGTISGDTKLPTPADLIDLLNKARPEITLNAKEKFTASLMKTIKSLGDDTELGSYVNALENASTPEKAAELQLVVDNLRAKQRVKTMLENLATSLEGKTLAESVEIVTAATAPGSELINYVDKTEFQALESMSRTAASFDPRSDVQGLNSPNLATYRAAIDNLCLVLSKTDSFCVLKGNEIDPSGLPEFKGGDFDRLIFQGGYNFRRYNLFNPAAAFADQISKKDFHSPSAQVIYNYRWGGTRLLGIGVGMEKANNAGGLTEIDIRDFMTTTSGTTTREFGETKKALLGDFKQYTRTFVNADFAIFPPRFKGLLGVNFFARSEVTGLNKGFRPGIGIFLSEKGKPTKVIGGASVSLDSNGKANIALTAGYNF